MSAAVDIAGEQFGKLTVIERAGAKHGRMMWRCRCQCNNETIVRGNDVRSGNTTSCGKCRNDIDRLSDGTTIIFLERQEGERLKCYIDSADYPLVKDYRWHAQLASTKHTFYAAADVVKNAKRTTIQMQRILCPTALTVDHKDRRGLNNRRLNLHFATQSQQSVKKRQLTTTNIPEARREAK